MNRAISPSGKKPSGKKLYCVARVVSVWGLARSSYYAAARRRISPRTPGKRGPCRISDEDLLVQIRDVMGQTGDQTSEWMTSLLNSLAEWYSVPTRNGFSTNGFIIAEKIGEIVLSVSPVAVSK